MSKSCNNNIELKRNGTGQNQRFVDALDPDSVELFDFRLEDWMAFAYNFANHVNYFAPENNVSGNWQDFFLTKNQIEKILGETVPQHKLSPHLTLFVCFICLLRRSQKRLNGLTKRHLDFYYKEVLNLSNKTASPDSVHILFELAKNASDVKIEQNTKLKAGRDKSGKNLVYKTTEEIILNQAKVAGFKNVYHLKDKYLFKDDYFGCSEVANSYDGNGKSFPNDEIKWWPFGHPFFPVDKYFEKDYPRMADARVGFAIASPVLQLEKGKREITFKISIAENIPGKITASEIEDALTVYLSGEKKWLQAVFRPVGQSFISGNEINIVVTLDANADPVVNYNSEKLLENFTTSFPVARFIFKNGINDEKHEGYKLYKLLVEKTVTNIEISVDVSEIIDAEIENDQGKLDASKPFFPFGSIPGVGSGLLIHCNEAANKEWTKITAKLKWKDTPDSFRQQYWAYREEYLTDLSKKVYNLQTEYPAGFDEDLGTLLINSDSDFRANVELRADNGTLINKGNSNITLFNPSSGGGFEAGFDVIRTIPQNKFATKSNNLPQDYKKWEQAIQDKKLSDNQRVSDFKNNKPKQIPQDGYLKIILKSSFYHDIFPRIFAVAMSKGESTTLIPNSPYTPQVESILLSYQATASQKIRFEDLGSDQENKEAYNNAKIELFHEHPFGQSEQHSYLKKLQDFLAIDNSINCKLLPTHTGGSLFIAVENAESLQSICLLTQVLEGSENPEPDNEFETGEKLQWYILCNEEWKPLNKDYITFDNTDNFLKSGIIKFTIPKEATKNNKRIPGNYFWLRVHNTKDFDTICQVIDIQAQAVLAQFSDNNNDLAHLKNGIEAKTISKLVERIATVKKVEQPYNSFDGKLPESDSDFYRRVSERLRHKQRAITIWDYEHLVLQKFPKIYKVNCLRHTSNDCFLSPGNVTVIVIPNIQKKNVFDIYQPRISKGNLNEIQSFINGINTLHVNATVENPQYEEVMAELSVKFYKGFDENYYLKQLQKDIAKFLAPWAFEKTASINFGIVLHESSMIQFIENLGYVDYIKNFNLSKQLPENDKKGVKQFVKARKIIPSSAKVILTSIKYEEHKVSSISNSECNN
ncbi:MAG: baseplate J/gp47 family protein [Mariniphaga sp.]|nr:baseplate J/gp47 family protein [Mariniphaga sp.]